MADCSAQRPILREEILSNTGPAAPCAFGSFVTGPTFSQPSLIPELLLSFKGRFQPVDFALYLHRDTSVKSVKKFLFLM